MTLADGYRLVDEPAPGPDAVRLRRDAGLGPKTLDQTTLAAAGSWAGAHVVGPDGTVVGMGRVIGDGGWYFHIADMAIDPEHQRRGIGGAILARLLQRIEEDAPDDAYITLLADEPGRPLYRHHGFVDTAPTSIGMRLPR